MLAANASVLIVDDSSTMRTILRDMAVRIGFRVVDEADGGHSALAKLHQRSFTLIISDWNMEPMSGIELLREVKRISTPKQNRFIFVTTERSWGNQTTARLDGAEAFVTKPFTLATLRTKVDLALQSC